MTESERRGLMAAAWRYALALLISAVAWGVTVFTAVDLGVSDSLMWWLLVGDLALGLVSFVLIRWRHRQPVVVGIVLGLFSFVSASSAGPASWVVGSLAAHRRWRLLSLVVPVTVVGGVVQERIGATEDPLPLWASIVFGLLVAGILVATGYAMSSQRQLPGLATGTVPSPPSASSSPGWPRRGRPSAPASRARCTTCSLTASRSWR